MVPFFEWWGRVWGGAVRQDPFSVLGMTVPTAPFFSSLYVNPTRFILR